MRRANNKNYATAILPKFWQDTEMKPKTGWERWQKIFMVATMENFSIYSNKTIQEPDTAPLGSLNVLAAEKISVQFLALRKTARKTLVDRKPRFEIETIKL